MTQGRSPKIVHCELLQVTKWVISSDKRMHGIHFGLLSDSLNYLLDSSQYNFSITHRERIVSLNIFEQFGDCLPLNDNVMTGIL